MMAGREYWSRSAPTGRSPSSVKWLCCAIGAGSAAASRSAGALCACKCTKKCGRSCERERVFCAVFAPRNESAQWAEKSGEVLLKMSLLFAKSPRLFGDTCPFFRSLLSLSAGTLRANGRQVRAAVKKCRAVAPTGTKNPRLRRGEDGECGRKTTERGMIKGLCSCL